MAAKNRKLVLAFFPLLVIAAAIVIILPFCTMLRRAGDSENWPLFSHRYLNADDYYLSSKAVHFIPQQDSLIRISYVHFTPTYNAWVLTNRHLADNSFTDNAQFNFRSGNQIFLAAHANHRGQVLLDSLELNGKLTGYDYTPLSVVTRDGDALLFWLNRAKDELFQVVYARGVTPYPEPEQDIPVVCGNWKGKNLVYTLSYRKGMTKLAVHEVLNWKSRQAEGTNPSAREPKTIFEIKAKPLIDEICMFRSEDRTILTLPLLSSSGTQLAVLDPEEQQLVDLLPADDSNKAWIALGAKTNRLELAQVDKANGQSRLYGYNLAGNRLVQEAELKGCIRDAAELENGDLLLLSDKGLMIVDRDFHLLRSRSLKQGDRIFAAKHGKRRLWFVWQPSKQRVIALGDDLKIKGKMRITSQCDDVYALHLGRHPDPNSRKLNLILCAGSKASNSNKMISTQLDNLPEAPFANLLFRIKELAGIIGSFLLSYLRSHPLQLLIYAMMLGLALVFSLTFSRQLVKNKIHDLSSLMPVPNKDKQHLTRIMELLKRPSPATAAILNIDIVDFSSLVRQYHAEPELLSQILMDFYDMFIEEAAKNGGTIGKIMGDGIIAIFGWPNLGKLYVNDARKNLEDALKTAYNVLQKSLLVKGVSLQFRQGITLGDVFIGYYGNSLRKDYMAMGPALELSELVQKAALPNTVFADLKAVDAISGFDLPYSAKPHAEIMSGEDRHQIFLLESQFCQDVQNP